MTGIAYSVTATFPDEATASEYTAWLQDGHVDAVIQGGARQAMIVRLIDPPLPPRVETRYLFATRALFDIYIEKFAPALRADGLQRFPPDRAITFERRTGIIL